MPHLDPLVFGVARRYLAKIEGGRRVAIEYARRRHGLERVEHGHEDDKDGDRDIDDQSQPR
jgi:hypothetical protein